MALKSNKCNQIDFASPKAGNLRRHLETHSGRKSNTCNQCTMCTLYSFFPPRPSAVGYIVQPHTCHIIEHIFVPTRSVEGNIEKIRFSWVSNSKFVIFPQIYPCSNYKIFPNVPLLFPVSNGDSPVVTTFPRSNYRGFLTTGESYCTMYTLCTVGELSASNSPSARAG